MSVTHLRRPRPHSNEAMCGAPRGPGVNIWSFEGLGSLPETPDNTRCKECYRLYVANPHVSPIIVDEKGEPVPANWMEQVKPQPPEHWSQRKRKRRRR